MTTAAALLPFAEASNDPDAALDRVFFALSDPVRREILAKLDDEPRLVSELAAPFEISLQAVSRHIQVLVRAGLVSQERTGRISRCRIETGPIFTAAVWMNRYTKYWQAQFEVLAASLEEIERQRGRPGSIGRPSRTRQKRRRRT